MGDLEGLVGGGRVSVGEGMVGQLRVGMLGGRAGRYMEERKIEEV